MKTRSLGLGSVAVLLMLVTLAAAALSGCAGIFPGAPGTPDAQKAQTAPAGKKIIAAVSIVPQDTFVKAVAGPLVETVVLIPPGYSPENYAPSPRELIPLSEASLYLSIGIPLEEASILPSLADITKNLRIVDLAGETAKIYPDRE